MKSFFIYIMANKSKTLVTGLTNNLDRRVHEHKHKLIPGISSKFDINRLVYYEETCDINEAVGREKQIKGWAKESKIALIESFNPNWEDLTADGIDHEN